MIRATEGLSAITSAPHSTGLLGSKDDEMQNFMPWHGLIGGVLIGLAAGFYLLVVGRIAGISSIIEGVLRPSVPTFRLNLAFLVGLPLGGALVALLTPGLVPVVSLGGGALWLVAAGFLVGLGARMANGCTSGHGVCGLPRFSGRSIAATATFMASAALTVYLVRHAGLGG